MMTALTPTPPSRRNWQPSYGIRCSEPSILSTWVARWDRSRRCNDLRDARRDIGSTADHSSVVGPRFACTRQHQSADSKPREADLAPQTRRGP
jgi:hypothetical protein